MKSRNVPKNESPPLALPDAAKLLGTLLRALNVSPPRRRRESIRKYLRGARPVGGGMLDAVIDAVIGAGYVADADGVDASALVKHSLNHAVVSWDRLIGHVNPAISRAEVRTALVARFLRLAALDFAVRASAFDALTGTPRVPACLDDPEVPTWAHSDGLRPLLRSLPKLLGMTRSKLSPQKRFDDLLDGRGRPSLVKIKQFAAAIARHDRQTPLEVWRRWLLWAFALESLCNEVAAVIGRDAVEDIASAFRRLRSHLRQILLEQGRNAAWIYLFIVGARTPGIEPLIEQLVRMEVNHDEVVSALSRTADVSIEPSFWDQVTKRVAWGTDLRACHAEWILAAFPVLLGLGEPVPADDLPSGFARRLLHATRADADPAEFAQISLEHPATFLWAARTVVQRSFLAGHFEPALMIVAKVADALRRPESYLEAAIVYVAAGRIEDAARYLQQIVTVEPYTAIARPLLGMVYALAGRHVDALEQLDAPDGQDITYVRGVALLGIGRVADALRLFEDVIKETPTNALAWEQAARCCDELAAAARGKQRARWTTRANRYAKLALRFGRSI
ncbi:MAG TPA: tetratricopeptide repeat protein, partial [Kofleriaceae bacterium]|nr:tetratricopeptide repeat protein [Kofleriaceae bacterium]